MMCNYTISVDPQKFIILTFQPTHFGIEGSRNKLARPSVNPLLKILKLINITAMPPPIERRVGNENILLSMAKRNGSHQAIVAGMLRLTLHGG